MEQIDLQKYMFNYKKEDIKEVIKQMVKDFIVEEYKLNYTIA